MKAPTTLFNKIFARKFYQHNAILFLIVFGIGAGLLSGREHVALAEFFISDKIFTLIPLVLWVFYLLNVFEFIQSTVNQKENEVVYYFAFYSKRIQYTTLTLTWANLLMPIIGYGIFLIIIAHKHQQFGSAILLLSYLVILLVVGIAKHLHLLLYPNVQVKVSRLKKWVDKIWTRHYTLILVEQVARKYILTIVLLKILGCFLLAGVWEIYQGEQFDDRLLNMTVVIIFGMNSIFAFPIYQFENIELMLIRNLPLPLIKRLLYLLVCLIILCLPEALLIVRNSILYFTWLNMFVTMFLGISVFILINSFLYVKSFLLTKFTALIFYISMLELTLVILTVPPVTLMIFNSLVGIILYVKYYYRMQAA